MRTELEFVTHKPLPVPTGAVPLRRASSSTRWSLDRADHRPATATSGCGPSTASASASRADRCRRRAALRGTAFDPRTLGACSPAPSVAEVAAALAQHQYLPDEGLATAIFLALRLHRPLLLEGEAGVGKTEVAKVADAAGRAAS